MTIARVDPSYPVLSTDFQFSLLGVVFGTGTAYKLLEADGLGLPPTRSTDTERAGAHGSFGGQEFAATRDITLRIGIQPRVGDPALSTLLANLKNAFSPQSSDVALACKLAGEPAAVFIGRPRKCDAPYDVIASRGTYIEALTLFTALDPLKYAAALHDIAVPYGTAGTNAGFTFNRLTGGSGLAFNRATPAATPGAASDAAAGGGGSAGFIQVTNAGNEPSVPVTRISAAGGPVTGPLHLQRVESGEDIVLNYNMSSGDVLELDHDLHTVFLNGTTNRADIVDVSTQWWVLQPGLQTIHYRSEGPGAGSNAEVLWRDAYW